MVGTAITTGERVLPAPRQQRGFWRHPQRVWLRRAMFQIHLWTGLLLCLYSLVIGVSGSVLVFEDDLGRLSYPQLNRVPGGAPPAPVTGASFARIAAAVRQAEPSWTLSAIYAPGVRGDNYAVLLSRNGKYRYVYASAADGHLLGGQSLEEGWLNWVADLHFRLLGGPVGFIVNGIGAACLLLLCITGAVVWWPGVKTWKRALTVDFGRRWKRINFDLHSAVGFWTLALMSLWAVSGVYFVWPERFVAAVNFLSSTPNAAPPKLHVALHAQSSELGIPAWVEKASAAAGSRFPLQGIGLPSGDQPASVMLARGDIVDFSHTTWVYIDPVRAGVLGFWRSGNNETLGDWFVWIMGPAHFGTYWGFGVKVLWAVLGCALPLLAITGVLMYWNRYLSKKWRALRNATPAHAV
jgi:uncharacterized iron-regulated membrane protein